MLFRSCQLQSLKDCLICSRRICFYKLSVFVVFLLSHRDSVIGGDSVSGGNSVIGGDSAVVGTVSVVATSPSVLGGGTCSGR